MVDRGESKLWQCVQWQNVAIPMRDGIALAADISFPSVDGVTPASGQYPTLLMRTPYNKEAMSAMPPDMVATATMLNPARGSEAGYVIIYQDVRGTFESEGDFEPLQNEALDGVDTVAWIRSQPWSDGRVGTFGPSYLGGAHILLAAEQSKGLITVFSQAPATDQFNNGWVNNEGVFDLQCATEWTVLQAGSSIARESREAQEAMEDDYTKLGTEPVSSALDGFPPATLNRLLRTLPLRDLPIARNLSWWRHWLDNRENPAHFRNNDMQARFAEIEVPIMHVGGWYDLFLRNTYRHYEQIIAQGRTAAVRDGQRLMIGPWSHSDCVDCPPGATVDGQAMQLAWMDQWLKGKPHPSFVYPVMLYIMGENRWRAEAGWPLPDTQRTRYYLHSKGHANTADGDGTLSTEHPADEIPDQYRYDPIDPVPSIGGIALHGARAAQNEVENRPDVLCYTTPELSEDVEVTGEVTAMLYAASSAEDTDWWMRLIDVAPDGRADTLNHGVVRARYRNSRSHPERLIPGAVVEYAINLQATGNVFKKGHRIRVEVSSSCFPLGERSPNAFVDLSTATEADFVVAEQTVYHDQQHASFIELPIIPLSRPRQWIETPFPLASGKHFDFADFLLK